MNRSLILAALVATTFSVSTSAAVYRWVDAEGHVHYTDKPVQNSEPVNTQTGQPKGAEPAPQSWGSVTRSSGITGASGAVSPDQLAQKKSECDEKKKQYDSYKNAAKIVETDSLGRRHEYSADEQKQLADKAQKAMEESCAAAGVTTTSTPGTTPPGTTP